MTISIGTHVWGYQVGEHRSRPVVLSWGLVLDSTGAFVSIWDLLGVTVGRMPLASVGLRPENAAKHTWEAQDSPHHTR